MRWVILSIGFIIFNLGQLISQNATYITDKLYVLPDVIIDNIKSNGNESVTYDLRVKQLVNHSNPGEGHFYQRVFLNHVGIDKPTVIVTEGYSCNAYRPAEVSKLLDANQISVEHRYFGESLPSLKNYDYLNLKQATTDLHHITTLFKTIYPQKWISTGISKGGATTIFYRYFYPDDVDVSIPYVAPINKEFEDKRIYQFLDTVGSDECREKIYDYQVRMLESTDKVLPLLSFYAIGANLTYNYLTIGEAYEMAVLEYPFSFFQWGSDCDDIPGINSSIEEMVKYLLEVSGIDFFSDKMMIKYASHYYQSAEEMGYYGYDINNFSNYLTYLPTDTNPHAAFVPDKMEVSFNGELLNDIHEWINRSGNQFIYIYGAKDTWSASAISPSEHTDALIFMMEGENHASARIRNLSLNDKKLLVTNLERWLDIEIIYD
ncbi:MAG: S28 family serine protease [Bacteroidales bacterium]|jgi:hypothetical protein|nr:S28 family serine protease [Bacteroidales bacterium]MDG2080254.1 S28 family serine protease [Bacteroidales bacterium]|tara:strand:- start:2055 stop:3353 length:1299 start_codon:yes stop_codon:yes gene_type:complete